MTGLVDRVKFRERRSHRSGKSAFSTPREYFTNNHIIIYLISIYDFSDFATHIFLYYIFHLIKSSATQGDGITKVTRGRKNGKARNSPTLPSQPKSGSSEPTLLTPVRPKPSLKNSIPVILSSVDEKVKNWRTLMGELRQYHPSLKISRIKELPKGDFVVIGDSVQDVIILQNESKMKAALGKNVKD